MTSPAARVLPVLEWLPRYGRDDLAADLLAGATVAAMMIPQSMAYVHVAGFPPVVGLYCSVVPLLVYALLGRSRTLAIGPVASVALLTAAAIGGVAQAGTDEYLEAAATLTLLVGVVAILIGIGHLGFITKVLSEPVLTGFLGGIGVVIVFSQIPVLLGVPVHTGTDVAAALPHIVDALDQVSWPDLAFGSTTACILLVSRRWRLFPAALVTVAGSMVVVWAVDLSEDVDVVGAVPEGLARPIMPSLELTLVGHLAPMAVAIALIGFVETMALVRAQGGRVAERPRPNGELVAYGATNASSAIFQGIPVLGVPTRTAVAIRSGARTQMTAVIAAGLALLILLVATGIFAYLPTATLAGIVLVAGLSFFRVDKALRYWRVKRSDFLLALVTFAITPTVGLQWGVLVGAVLSIAIVVYRAARPPFIVLGRRPGTDAFVDISREAGLEERTDTLIVRIDGPLFYGNADSLTERMLALEDAAEGRLEHLVLDCSGVDDLDTTAADALRTLLAEQRERGVDLTLTNVKERVAGVMAAAGLTAELGENRMVPTDLDAMELLDQTSRTDPDPPPAEDGPDGDARR